jgi:SOS response associated peptidase (SRAP)
VAERPQRVSSVTRIKSTVRACANARTFLRSARSCFGPGAIYRCRPVQVELPFGAASFLADGFYEWRKTTRPKLPFAIAMKDGRPFTFAPALEKTGKIPNPENGCALAQLSQANPMSSSRKSIPACR